MAVMTALGFLVLGMFIGFLAFREISNLAHQSRSGPGQCWYCGTKAYCVKCARCKRQTAMCHYYGVLATDDPAPRLLRTRRGAQVCMTCLTDEEKKILEQIVKG
jgi:hypothetical protein